MANALTDKVWVIDTAESLTTDPVYIKKIRWSGATTAGHTAIIHDQAGKVVWSSVAAGANNVEAEQIESHVINGLDVDTLASGTLYITIG